jgi:alkyl hydroperoxide reductase subunit AhpF
MSVGLIPHVTNLNMVHLINDGKGYINIICVREIMVDRQLSDEIKQQLSGIFNSELKHSVEIVYFSKKEACYSCEEIHFLLDEIISASDKLHFSSYDLDEYPALAQQYHVELAPCLVIAGRDGNKLLDYGIRFNGIPSGFEFSSLIQDILIVSKRDSGLRLETREQLRKMSSPIHLKVFVTPT